MSKNGRMLILSEIAQILQNGYRQTNWSFRLGRNDRKFNLKSHTCQNRPNQRCNHRVMRRCQDRGCHGRRRRSLNHHQELQEQPTRRCNHRVMRTCQDRSWHGLRRRSLNHHQKLQLQRNHQLSYRRM